MSANESGASAPPVGRCIGCFHNFAYGPCGGCGAVDEHPKPKCNGICVMASELVEGMDLLAVAYAHPECELHAEIREDDRG